MAMVVLHGALLPLSFIFILAMLVPTIARPASVQYFTLMIFVLVMCCYSIFGLVVYCHSRFLLRVLGGVSAAILFLMTIAAICSCLRNVACRRHSGDPRHSFNISLHQCESWSQKSNALAEKFKGVDNYEEFADKMEGCVYPYRYEDECSSLPQFWKTVGPDSENARAFLKPLAGFYSTFSVMVLFTTLWHTVDEVRFSKSICTGCGLMP